MDSNSFLGLVNQSSSPLPKVMLSPMAPSSTATHTLITISVQTAPQAMLSPPPANALPIAPMSKIAFFAQAVNIVLPAKMAIL